MQNTKITFDLDLVRSAFTERHPEKKGQNVSEFAAEFKMSHTALYNWKKGINMDRIETVLLMLEKTGLTFEQLFKIEKS